MRNLCLLIILPCIFIIISHTSQEAKSLPAIGAKLADKIWEIIESGGLRKLDEFKSNEEMNTLELFSNVWGAGAITSRQWYQQVNP